MIEKADKALLNWKQGKGESALLVEGARRTEKSTFMETFATKRVCVYLTTDFETVEQSVKDLFVQYRNDVDKFFKRLSAFYGIGMKRQRKRSGLLWKCMFQRVGWVR